MIAEEVAISRLAELEAVIASSGPQAYQAIGNALREIRDSHMYAPSFTHLDHYCISRWGWREGQVRNYIRAATVANELNASSAPSLTQAAILGKLTPDQRAMVVSQIEAGQGLAKTSTREIRRIVAAVGNGHGPQISMQPVPRDLQVPALGQRELWACQVHKEFERQLVRLVRMFEKSNPPIGSIIVMRTDDAVSGIQICRPLGEIA